MLKKGGSVMKEISFGTKSDFNKLAKHINERGKNGMTISEKGVAFIRSKNYDGPLKKYLKDGRVSWMIEEDKYKIGGMSIFYKGKVLKKRSHIPIINKADLATIFAKDGENLYELYFPLVESYLIFAKTVTEETSSYIKILDSMKENKEIAQGIQEEYNFSDTEKLKYNIDIPNLFGFKKEDSEEMYKTVKGFAEQFTEETVVNESVAHIETLFGRNFLTACSYNLSPKARRKVFLNKIAGSAMGLWGFLLEDLKGIGVDILFIKNTSLLVSCTEEQAEKVQKLALKLHTNLEGLDIVFNPSVEKY